MVGSEESKSLPPVATNVSRPFTINCIASRLLRNTERLAKVVGDVDDGFDPDRQSYQFLPDARGLELGSIHLLVGGAGRMDHQRLGVADIGQMADHAQGLDEFLAGWPAAPDSEADDGARAARQQAFCQLMIGVTFQRG